VESAVALLKPTKMLSALGNALARLHTIKCIVTQFEKQTIPSCTVYVWGGGGPSLVCYLHRSSVTPHPIFLLMEDVCCSEPVPTTVRVRRTSLHV
jgi:hypothetical protein